MSCSRREGPCCSTSASPARCAASGSDRLTRSGIAVGTSTYMSPEQITALQEIDHRSDLYSLACVLFECLAGQPPFVHRNEAVVLQLHLTQPAPDVRTLRPEIPAELAAGIARALAKTPEDRWQTAAGHAGRAGRGHGRVALAASQFPRSQPAYLARVLPAA